MHSRQPAIWFPTVRTGTGSDVFTERLVAGLSRRGIHAEITWLPLRSEYAAWTVPAPEPPAWANVAHINSWLAARFHPRHLPLVVTVHHCVHDPLFRPYKSLAQAIYHRVHIKAIERRALVRAYAITTVSRYTADRTRAAFGSFAMQVIAPGIDPHGPYQPLAARHSHAPFRLIFAGTGSRRKGADLLAPIMERLGDGFELTVVGTNEIPAARPPRNILIRGRLQTSDDLADAYRSADALLFPTRLEGFGLVALEAMACGLPVIATHGSSLVEVVEDGVTGILCPQDDVKAFTSAILRLAADRELTATMSAAARRRAVEVFGMDAMIDAYADLYDRCMRRPNEFSNRACLNE